MLGNYYFDVIHVQGALCNVIPDATNNNRPDE